MGDGVSDLGRRGELGDAEQEAYFLGRVRANGVMRLHERSVLAITNSAAIHNLIKQGKLKRTIGANGWMLLEEVKDG